MIMILIKFVIMNLVLICFVFTFLSKLGLSLKLECTVFVDDTFVTKE